MVEFYSRVMIRTSVTGKKGEIILRGEGEKDEGMVPSGSRAERDRRIQTRCGVVVVGLRSFVAPPNLPRFQLPPGSREEPDLQLTRGKGPNCVPMDMVGAGIGSMIL